MVTIVRRMADPLRVLCVVLLVVATQSVALAGHGSDDWAHQPPTGWNVFPGYGGQNTVSNCDNHSAGPDTNINDANDATLSTFAGGNYTNNCWGLKFTRTLAAAESLTIRSYRLTFNSGGDITALVMKCRPQHNEAYVTVVDFGGVESISGFRTDLPTPFVTNALQNGWYFDCYLMFTGGGTSTKTLGSFELYGEAADAVVGGSLRFGELWWGAFDHTTNLLDDVHYKIVGASGEIDQCALYLTPMYTVAGGFGPYARTSLGTKTVGTVYDDQDDWPFTQGPGTYDLTCEQYAGDPYAARATIEFYEASNPPPAGDPEGGQVIDGQEVCGSVDVACAIRNLGRGLFGNVGSALHGAFVPRGEVVEGVLDSTREAYEGRLPFSAVGAVTDGMGQLGNRAASSGEKCWSLTFRATFPSGATDIVEDLCVPSTGALAPLWSVGRSLAGAYIGFHTVMWTWRALQPKQLELGI